MELINTACVIALIFGCMQIDVSFAAAPVWNLATQSYTLDENTAPNVRIVDLVATDADGDTLTFSIDSVTDAAYTNYFTISNDDLVVGSASPDVEAAGLIPVITVVLSVTDTTTTVLTTITVTIVDLDDVAPVVTLTPSTVYIEEKKSLADVGTLIAVTDGDFTAFSPHTVTITAGDSSTHFAISTDLTKVETTGTAIDYEVTSSYLLQITATDTGGNTGSSTLTVTIETPPGCGALSYDVTFPENPTAGDTVLDYSARCVDDDSLPSTPLTYTFDSAITNPEFELTSAGVLIVSPTASFDFEQTPLAYTGITVTISDGKYSTTCPVASVTISDVNEAPYITSASTVSVADGTSSGTILALTAYDDDDDALTYYITSVTPTASLFTINTADLVVTGALDRATSATYTVAIQVLDASLTGTQDVVVNINGAPVITTTALTVDEGESVGHVVHTLVATDPDGDGIALTLTPLAGSEIQLVGSDLTTNTVFDFETGTTTYNLVISAVDDSTHAMSSEETFTLTINDVNEAPEFEMITYTVSQLEGAFTSPGNLITMTITDEDTGDDAVSCSIDSGNTNPVIFVVSFNAGKCTLSMNGPLVYAASSSYTLGISAPDGSGLTGSTTVTVDVTTAPVITSPLDGATLNVDETSSVDDVISAVLATEADGDSLTYSSSDPLFGFVGTNFVVKGALDFDQSPTSYAVTISVEDPDSNSATIDITVQLTDANDNTPVFESTPYAESTLEHSPTAVCLLSVTASDADSSANDNNVVKYYIEAGNDAGLFTLDETTGDLSATNLDYDTMSVHTLTVVAKDRPDTGGDNTETVSVTITVEKAPYYTAPTSVNQPVPVPETTSVNAVVFTFTATDDDSDDATLTYEFVSVAPSGCPFEAGTGDNLPVILNADADYEATPPASCIVTAKVTDSDGHTSQATIDLVITAENDNSPVFNPASYTVDHDETTAIGTSIAQVTATDADLTSAHNTISYSITGGNDAGKFAMSTTVVDEIVLAGPLDDQTAAVYTLTVTASDGPNTDTTTVTVNVALSPVFETPDAPLAIDVNEDIADTDMVVLLSASDLNSDSITYAIATQTNSGQFEVDEVYDMIQAITIYVVSLSSGQSLDYETNSDPIELTFTANDGNGHTVTSQKVTLTIVDVNDENPTFPLSTYSVELKDASPIGTSVKLLVPTDADGTSPNNQIASFAITAGDANSDFTITNVGYLSVAKVLDRATTSSYSLTVQATDGGTPALQGTTTVDVTVIEDTDPVITAPATATAIDLAENTAVNTLVYTVIATDQDGDVLSITIKNLNPPGKFGMEGSSLKLLSELDYETTTSYTVDFEVDDNDGDASNKQTSGLLTITVLDVNDCPKVAQSVYNATILSGRTIEQFVAQITATDDETTQTLTYSKVDGDPSDNFQVNNTGYVTTKNYGVNYVKQNHFFLVINIMDNAAEPCSESVFIDVKVLPMDSGAGHQTAIISTLLSYVVSRLIFV